MSFLAPVLLAAALTGTPSPDTIARAPTYLYDCRKSTVHRDTTSSGYVSASISCTSGVGGQRTYLAVSAGGTRLSDRGPCVGKYSGSPAYIWVPWYLGGPQRAVVVSYYSASC
jgi:hypothetical protein